jgi:antitoxin component of RelBE/YafQ-DinJ toxin-antitoxin module
MIVFLVGLLLIILELFRTRRKTVQLKDKSGELMVDSIGAHLTYHLDLLPDVLRVRPEVSSRGKTLRATIHVETPPDVNVPQKSAEVKETARKVIEEQLGLQTKGDIRVIVRPIAYPKISPIEQKRPSRADRPVTPPLPPVEAIIEEEEKRAEPLYPEKEELPFLAESPPMPFEAVEPQFEQEEPEEEPLPWEQETPAQEDEEESSLDVKGPPSEPFG